MEQITRVQIQESIDTYVKTYITDAEWHISLVYTTILCCILN